MSVAPNDAAGEALALERAVEEGVPCALPERVAAPEGDAVPGGESDGDAGGESDAEGRGEGEGEGAPEPLAASEARADAERVS